MMVDIFYHPIPFFNKEKDKTICQIKNIKKETKKE